MLDYYTRLYRQYRQPIGQTQIETILFPGYFCSKKCKKSLGLTVASKFHIASEKMSNRLYIAVQER
jgi:hypothetical protein